MELRSPNVALLVCSIVLGWTIVDPVAAAQQKAKGQASPITSPKPIEPLPEQVRQPGKNPIAPAISDRRLEGVPNSAKQTQVGAKASSSKVRSHVTVRKKVVPKAVMRPRTDLMYHGLLEDAQRYDPRPTSRMAGVSSPQTRDLTHDHFQELDRNQDGMIDPVEKAFGRLDLDHDLATSQR